MRAYQLLEGGAGIDALVKVEGPEPKPAYRQVLVKVAACSLNFRDLGIVRGTYRMPVQDHIVPLSDGPARWWRSVPVSRALRSATRSPAASSNAGPAVNRPRMCRRMRSAAASTACWRNSWCWRRRAL